MKGDNYLLSYYQPFIAHHSTQLSKQPKGGEPRRSINGMLVDKSLTASTAGVPHGK